MNIFATDVARIKFHRYSFRHLPEGRLEMSEYDKLKEKGMGRGRPRHTDEQREKAKAINAIRQEARRRAHLVLKNRHDEEFREICEQEMKALLAERTDAPVKKKSTRKSS